MKYSVQKITEGQSLTNKRYLKSSRSPKRVKWNPSSLITAFLDPQLNLLMLVANKSSNFEFRRATQKGGIGNAYFSALFTLLETVNASTVCMCDSWFSSVSTLLRIDRSKGGNWVVAIITVLPNNLPCPTSPDDNKSRRLIPLVYHCSATLRSGAGRNEIKPIPAIAKIA